MGVGSLSLPVAFSYTDSTHWSVSLSGATVSLGSVSLGASGSLTDTGGVIAGTLTLQTGTGGSPSAISLGGGVTLTGSVTFTYNSSASSASFSGTLTLAVGSAMSLPVSFSYTNANNWSVAVTGATLPFLSTSLSIFGSLTKSSSGLTGTLSLVTGTTGTPTPISLGGGVTLTGSLTFVYNSGASSPAFSGALTLTLSSGFTLSANLSYTDSTHWTLTVSASSGSGGFTVAPGFVIPATSITGTLTDAGSGVQWSLSATLGPITLVSGVATLTTVTVSIGTICPSGHTTFCTGGGDSLYFAISGSLSFIVPGSTTTLTATVDAIVGVQSKRFELAATLTGTVSLINTSGISVSLTNPTLDIGYNDPSFATLASVAGTVSIPGSATSSGLALLLTGSSSISIFGHSLTINFAVLFTNSGFLVAASFTGFTIAGANASIDTIAYSSFATTLKMDGLTVQLPKGTFILSGSIAIPDWLVSFAHIPAGNISIYLQYTSSSSWSINAVFTQSAAVSTGSSEFAFSFSNLTLSVSDLGGTITVSAAENGTLTISGSADGGATTVINIQLRIALDTTGNLLLSFSANGVNNQPIWSNVMGLTGLNINSLTLQGGINLTTLVPELGISASGTLPGTLLQELGMGDGNAIPITFALNLSDTNPCVQVTIGTPPSGGTPGPTIINIGGVVTASYASLVAAPDGCTIGTFTLQPGFEVAFDGTFLGVAIHVDATLTPNPFSFTANVTISSFSIGPFSSTGDSLTISITTSSFSLAFSGNISIDNVGTVTLSGSFDSSGDFTFNGNADISLGSFTLTMNVVASGNIKNILSSVSVTASATVTVVGVVITLNGSFTSPTDFTLTGNVDFAPGGFDMGNINFTFSVNGSTITFNGSASVDLGGVFTGTLAGSFVASPSGVAFYFSITVDFSIDGYDIAGGSLSIGNCTDASCTSVGDMSAGLTFTFLGASVSVTLSTDWSFSFDAIAASLKKIAGETLQAVVTFMNDIGATAVEIGDALKNEFDATATQITDAFDNAGVAIANGLTDFANATAQDAAQVLEEIGYTATEVANALQSAYSQVAAETAQILDDVGYAINDIATALSDAYNEVASGVATILNDIGYGINEISGALKDVFNTLDADCAQILKDIGATVDEIAGALDSIYNDAASAAATILNNLSYGVTEIASALKDAFNAADTAVATILNNLGKSLSDIASAMSSVFNDAAQTVANIFNSIGADATAAYNALKATFSNVSDTVWAGILSAAGWANSAIQSIGSAFSSFGDDISNAVDAVGNFFSSL